MGGTMGYLQISIFSLGFPITNQLLGIALYKAQQKDLQVAAFHQGSGLIFEINGQVDKVEATLEVLTGTRISSAAQFLLKKEEWNAQVWRNLVVVHCAFKIGNFKLSQYLRPRAPIKVLRRNYRFHRSTHLKNVIV